MAARGSMEPCVGSIAVFSDADGNLYSARRTFRGWMWNPPVAQQNSTKTYTWNDIQSGLRVVSCIEPERPLSRLTEDMLDDDGDDDDDVLGMKSSPRSRKTSVTSTSRTPRTMAPMKPIVFENVDELGANIAVLVGGQVLTGVHTEERCAGDTCAIHNVTEHPLSEWPQHYDASEGLIYRHCPHGEPHPDPDEAPYRAIAGRSDRHRCDGCCSEQYMLDAMKSWT